MQWRITGRVARPRANHVPGVREAACRACEWFCAPQEKCAHPNTARWAKCYSCAARVRPWLQPGGHDACPLGAKNK